MQHAAFSSIRVFALLDHNYYAAGIVLLLGLIPVGVGIVLRLIVS